MDPVAPVAPVVRYVAVRPLPDLGADVFTNEQYALRTDSHPCVFDCM